jgi:hypothetical protein
MEEDEEREKCSKKSEEDVAAADEAVRVGEGGSAKSLGRRMRKLSASTGSASSSSVASLLKRESRRGDEEVTVSKPSPALLESCGVHRDERRAKSRGSFRR